MPASAGILYNGIVRDTAEGIGGAVIEPAHAEIALGRVGGAVFEKFFHAFMSAIYGSSFVPLGGHHDGGADAFLEPIYEGSRAHRFLQASVEIDHRSKIRQTVNRLKEVGRAPVELTYCTSRQIDRLDQEDDYLTTELDVTIRIRDQRWIIANLNQSPRTMAAFNEHLGPELAFLRHLGGASLIDNVKQDDTRALFVFLEQELARRRDQSDVLLSTMDSLILWALEGTDPAQGIFLNREQILRKIEGILPSSKHFIRGALDPRLAILSSKSNPTGREIRHYRKEQHYCLPYETRQKVEAENAHDELLKKHFLDGIEARARPYFLVGDKQAEQLTATIRAAHGAIERAFERQGIELAAFVSGNGERDQPLSIADYVDETLADMGLDPSARVNVKEASLAVLRQALYESNPIDREYFNKLSRTYTLLFTLRNDARVVEYFRSMSTQLILYVGADILVRALSEHYLRPEDKMTTNLLLILKKSGAHLILGDNALDEVWSNMKASDHEYNNWFKWNEPYITSAIVRHCSKILVRSYFYAKLSPPVGVMPPTGWIRYIDQFVTHSALHTSRGKEELQGYLCTKFGLTYETEEDMHKGVNTDHLEALKELLFEARSGKDKAELLAYNDALQALRIYAKRKEIHDHQTVGPLGYKTWWLTHETHVMRVSATLVKHYNARFIMRPEFVLNFIALAPTMEEVRTAYNAVFPSLLSIKLSNRLKDDVFHDVMGRYKRACEYDSARIEVKTKELSNRLKGDNFKEYEIELRADDQA